MQSYTKKETKVINTRNHRMGRKGFIFIQKMINKPTGSAG